MSGNTFKSKRRVLSPATGGYEDAPTDQGMGAADYAGIGLQLYGASLQDKAADEELKREEEQRKTDLLLNARNFRQNAAETERSAQQTDRSMNMKGIDMLTEQRMRAAQNAKQYSFRNSFLKAMGA